MLSTFCIVTISYSSYVIITVFSNSLYDFNMAAHVSKMAENESHVDFELFMKLFCPFIAILYTIE